MKRAAAISVAVAIVFTALWAVPLARAISFVCEAQDYFAETGSINASMDVRAGAWLLACYVASFLAAMAFAWLIFWRPRLLLIYPGALLAYAAVDVIWLQPERPIHLVPTMAPWRPVFICIVALAIAALFVCLPRTERRQP